MNAAVQSERVRGVSYGESAKCRRESVASGGGSSVPISLPQATRKPLVGWMEIRETCLVMALLAPPRTKLDSGVASSSS